MVISEGRRNLGLSFAEAYDDVAFRDKILKRAKPTSENLLALWNFMRAMHAKEELSTMVPREAKKAGKQARQQDRQANWKLVPVAGGGASSSDEPFAAATPVPRKAIDLVQLGKAWALRGVLRLLAWLWSLRCATVVWVIILLLMFPNTLDAILQVLADRVAMALVALADAVCSSLGRAASTIADAVVARWEFFEEKLALFIWRIFGRASAPAPAPQHIAIGHSPEYNQTVYIQAAAPPSAPPPALVTFDSLAQSVLATCGCALAWLMSRAVPQ